MKKYALRDPEVEVYAVRVGREDLVVMSLPAERPSAETAVLTAAEREIARLAVSGLTNAAIAKRRGGSPRTVANQLASVYRKLEVSSRAELAARLQR